MANWTNLKAAISSVIKTNNNQEITGQVLQNTLNSIVDTVGANAAFAGVATPSTNPGAPDGPVFYLASTAGTYSNFGGLVVAAYESVVLLWQNSAWQKLPITTPLANSTIISVSYDTSIAQTRLNVQEEIRKQGFVLCFQPIASTHLRIEKYLSNDTSDAEWQSDLNWDIFEIEQSISSFFVQDVCLTPYITRDRIKIELPKGFNLVNILGVGEGYEIAFAVTDSLGKPSGPFIYDSGYIESFPYTHEFEQSQYGLLTIKKQSGDIDDSDIGIVIPTVIASVYRGSIWNHVQLKGTYDSLSESQINDIGLGDIVKDWRGKPFMKTSVIDGSLYNDINGYEEIADTNPGRVPLPSSKNLPWVMPQNNRIRVAIEAYDKNLPITICEINSSFQVAVVECERAIDIHQLANKIFDSGFVSLPYSYKSVEKKALGLTIRKVGNAEISESEAALAVESLKISNIRDLKVDNFVCMKNAIENIPEPIVLVDSDFEQGTYNYFSDNPSLTRIRSGIIDVRGWKNIVIEQSSDSFDIFVHGLGDMCLTEKYKDSEWSSARRIIDNDFGVQYLRIVVKNKDDTEITPSAFNGSICIKSGLKNLNEILSEFCAFPLKYYTGDKIYLEGGIPFTSGINCTLKSGIPTVQGAALFGSELFVLTSATNSYYGVYNIDSGEKLKSYTPPNGAHCNSACFANEVAEGSAYPLLYVSEWDGNHRIFVEKIFQSEISVVQEIGTSQLSTDLIGLGMLDFAIDFENAILYTISYKKNDDISDDQTNLTHICAFNLPSASGGNVELSSSDLLWHTTTIPLRLRQDSKFINGKIYIIAGVPGYANSIKMVVFCPIKRQIVSNLDLTQVTTLEPEGIVFHEGRLLMTTQSSTVYYMDFG